MEPHLDDGDVTPVSCQGGEQACCLRCGDKHDRCCLHYCTVHVVQTVLEALELARRDACIC
jgi:hypothetical protein